MQRRIFLTSTIPTQNANEEVSDSIRVLICNLMDDAENGNEEALGFAQEMLDNAEGWAFENFYCADCQKRETVFFSATEMENIEKHSRREMLIQDAIPTKSPMVREWFVSGICVCPECWGKRWLADKLEMEELYETSCSS